MEGGSKGVNVSLSGGKWERLGEAEKKRKRNKYKLSSEYDT